MKIQFLTLTLIAIFSASISKADHSNISVTVNGTTYQCGNQPIQPTDPNCVKNLTDYCKYNTSNSSGTCFDLSTQHCKGSPSNFVDCVKQTTDYCKYNTSNSATVCFNSSLSACRGGNPSALIELMQNSTQSATRNFDRN